MNTNVLKKNRLLRLLKTNLCIFMGRWKNLIKNILITHLNYIFNFLCNLTSETIWISLFKVAPRVRFFFNSTYVRIYGFVHFFCF
jgi:hypothetical protein